MSKHFSGRRGASDSNEFLIYGVNPVAEILKSDRGVHTIYIQNQTEKHLHNILEIARRKHVPVKAIERDFFDARFDKGHQGIAASVSPKKTIDIDDMLDAAFLKKKNPFFLILDCVEDPRNFGAILRVADAAGVDGVVFQSRRAASITPLVYKASAGAVEHVSLSEIVNIKHAASKMKDKDVTIIGAEAGSDKGLWDVDLTGPVALILGSEGEGLRKTVGSMCDILITLPMLGTVNSLNVSVATGVIAYEVMRQRKSRR
jgi:23S rRNA (guanosine2251-2'-O)-methyltransferase